MKRALLFGSLIVLSSWSFGQVACPVSAAVDFWTGLTPTSSLAFSTYSLSVVIDGTLEVNTPVFTFDATDVGFKNGSSKIVVNPTCTLRIINGSTLTNLDINSRWHGIEVLPGGRVEVDASEICGAENAISCNSGFSVTASEFDIRNSFLRFNLTGVAVQDYSAGAYPGTVHNTHFQGGSVTTISPPYSMNGVVVQNVDPLVGSGLIIGEPTLTSTPNLFSDLEYGIQAFNTTLEVFNNDFEAIQDLSGSGSTGYAVYAEDRTPGNYTLKVGFTSGTSGGSLVPNSMTDCLHGVYVTGYDTVVINNNTMTAPTDSFRIGITVERTKQSISVLQNEIRQFGKMGILLNNNPGPGGGTSLDAAVSTNRIRGENLKTKGIFVDEFYGGLTVKQDTIDRVWRGIGIQSSDGEFNIRENKVDFRYPGPSITTDPAAGIYMLSSQEGLILRNTITGNCPSPAGGGPCNSYSVSDSRIRGIQLNQTENTRIYNNDVQYAGAGVYVQGPNDEGNMVCNNFFDTYSAVVWDNLPVDGFGSTTGPGGPFTNRVYGLTNSTAWSENTFTSSIPSYDPYRSWSINAALGGSIDWYFQNALTLNFPGATIQAVIPATPLAPTTGSSTNVCGLLKVANENDSILNPGNTSEMLEGPGMSNNTLTHRLVKWWIQGDLDSIDATMTNLSTMDSSSAWLRTVWHIRTNALRTGGELYGLGSYGNAAQTYTDEELFQLMQIALDTAAEQPAAAYLAQSMLDWSILQDRWQEPGVAERGLNPIWEQSGIVVYPNPTRHSVQIISKQSMSSIHLYNLKGEQMLQFLELNQEVFILSLDALPQGEYILRAIGMDGKQYAAKLLKN